MKDKENAAELGRINEVSLDLVVKRLKKLDIQIHFFQQLLATLTLRKSGGRVKYQKKRYVRHTKGAERDDQVNWRHRQTTVQQRSSLEDLLDVIDPFISHNMMLWDTSQLCILANDILRDQQVGARVRYPVTTDGVRRCLQLKFLSLGTNRCGLRIILLNILVPQKVVFADLFPFPPSSWRHRFRQFSIEHISSRLKVSALDLKKNIEFYLLQQKNSLEGVDYEKASIDVCGDETLASAIFSEAWNISIRPA